jgi:hypothetical protein
MGLLGLRNPAIVRQSQAAGVATSTPSIGTLSCIVEEGVNYVNVPVTNNDASTATIEISESSIFSPVLASASVSSGGVNTFSLEGYLNPPGSVTFYARATASGKSVSSTASRTQTINGCFGF